MGAWVVGSTVRPRVGSGVEPFGGISSDGVGWGVNSVVVSVGGIGGVGMVGSTVGSSDCNQRQRRRDK